MTIRWTHRLLWPVFQRAAQWRTRQLIGRALELADEPSLVLNLPCCCESFGPLLSTRNNRVVIAASPHAECLSAALANLHAPFSHRVHPLQTALLAIELDANAVDCIVCVHYLHQVDDPVRRMSLLREFNRVTRDSVIISVWVKGNLEAARHAKHPRGDGQVRNRAQIEHEFTAAGFRITGHRDLIPGLAMLRLYVLRKNS